MEHLQHFGLTQDPFQNEPDLRFYFDSASHREIQLRVERGLRQSKGLTVLTGDGGSGKTLVTRRIFDALEEEIFEASLMVMLPGAADASSVLNRFARQMGVEEPSTDRAALLSQLYEMLAIVREEGRHALLILDDAHVLDSKTMAEVGGLLNLEYEDRRLLSLLLVGLPQLEVALSHDPSLGQRVEVRARLQPLDLENSTSYVLHRLAVAGGNPATVPDDAMASLYKFSRGRPRLLNTLADNALFEAYLAGRPQLVCEDIERAAVDLGIGPDPGSTYSQLAEARPTPMPLSAAEGPLGDPALDHPLGNSMSGGSSAAEISSLFKGGGNHQAEITGLVPNSSDSLHPTADLDAGMFAALADGDSALEEDPDGQTMAVGGPSTTAEATRVAFADSLSPSIQIGEPNPADSPVATGSDAEFTRIAFPEEDYNLLQDAEPIPEASQESMTDAPTRVAFADELAPAANPLPSSGIAFGQNSAGPDPALAEATRIALPDEGPPKQSEDDIDDLFVDLIDD